jgi:hypothetical protein
MQRAPGYRILRWSAKEMGVFLGLMAGRISLVPSFERRRFSIRVPLALQAVNNERT